jgi:hypothetical protein
MVFAKHEMLPLARAAGRQVGPLSAAKTTTHVRVFVAAVEEDLEKVSLLRLLLLQEGTQ